MSKSTNGKGSRPRPTNLKKYEENYDSINWHRPSVNSKEERVFLALDEKGMRLEFEDLRIDEVD